MWKTIILVVFAAVLAIPAGAQSVYLQLGSGDENVQGEVTSRGYEGWIDVINFDVGTENTINIDSISAGGGAGKAGVLPLVIEKPIDTSSIALRSKLTEGSHFDEVSLVVVQRSPGGRYESYRLDLKLVMVESVALSGASGEAPMETVTFQFGAAQWTYQLPPTDGGPGETLTSAWSVVTNKAEFAVR
ncbi:MAG: type VI secretion system tube protein Hcp [Pseudomonadota bacterium]